MDDGQVREEGDAEAAVKGSAGLLGAFVQIVGDAAGRFESGLLASEGGGEDEGAHESDEVVCVWCEFGVGLGVWRSLMCHLQGLSHCSISES